MTTIRVVILGQGEQNVTVSTDTENDEVTVTAGQVKAACGQTGHLVQDGRVLKDSDVVDPTQPCIASKAVTNGS